MDGSPRILVTSALPYANGSVHFGHLAGAYLPADIFVRYQRLRGRDVLYICGSDEHGVSILISANKEGVTPREIIDRYHSLNREAFDGVGISFDNYSRTSLPVHHETAKEWFLAFHETGMLKHKVEQQLFDATAGMFLPDRFVVGTCPHCGYDRAYGDQCENCSKYYAQTELVNPRSLLSGDAPVVKDAVHWYFPLSAFQEQLESYVGSHEKDWKDNVLQQVRSWLKAGLSDRPISRDLTWGVHVPLDDAAGKVLYVWFEAVLGYISSTKEWSERIGDPERWKQYWCDPSTRYIAFIGKDNIVFHCLMFPAMLMGRGGYILPENVPANEFLNLEGKKFSKSMNWSIEIKDFLERFPADPLRYTLTMNMPESRDSDFYWKDFQSRNNNELADILGNFVNRTLHFTRKNFNGCVPDQAALTDTDKAFIDGFGQAARQIGECIERYRFRDGAQAMMTFARSCNKYFNDEQPWKTLKSDTVRCGHTINLCIQAIRALGVLMEPFLPFTSKKVRTMLRIGDVDPWSWDSAGSLPMIAGHPIGDTELLFAKIPDEAIDAEIAKLGFTAPAAPVREYAPIKSQISIDTFGAIDLRIGTIVEAERVPRSDKLLKLRVDIGSEVRQVVAGIGKAYTPEQLVGVTVTIVANLQPAKLFGVESQGMVLAATEDGGRPVLLTPLSSVAPGSIVK
jgi:methionyl-tRNA synthetase